MRLLPSTRVLGSSTGLRGGPSTGLGAGLKVRAWWGLFALLIAAPALTLSWLGLRAVRADRLQAEQQLRTQQQRIAELADAAIQTVLTQLGNDLGRPSTVLGANRVTPTIVFDRSGLVTFPGDRVYFGPFGRVPAERAALSNWPTALAGLIDDAQALEVQRRSSDAIALFTRIGRGEPRLHTWAAIAVARIRAHGDPASVRQLADEAWAASSGVTPSGLPAAFVACAAAEDRSALEKAQFAPLVRATLEGVRAGRWWLSAEERRFYDAQLRSLLRQASQAVPEEDTRLARLVEIDRLVRQSPPVRRDRPTHAVERGASTSYLVVWTAAEGRPDAWFGSAFDRQEAAAIVGPPLVRLLQGQPFGAAVRASNGGTIWSYGSPAPYWLVEPLRTLTDWNIAFTRPADEGGFARRERLWYAFVSLLLVMLLAGIGMTAHVVRREMELTRMQAEFVAAVTHEFKSPITSIRLLLERVSGGRLAAARPATHYYAAIGQETDRLERLVNRLLEAQQIEAGQRHYAFTRESLEDLTREVVGHLQPIADAKNVRVDVQVDGALPAVAVDRTAIVDAIENLVDNAIKYSRGGTRVLVHLRATADRVSIDVADQGIGIERDELARVFDKFYRARRGDLQSVRGTGLGLALVKAAAEAHGGTVDVESEPGVGSRFSLKLPA